MGLDKRLTVKSCCLGAAAGLLVPALLLAACESTPAVSRPGAATAQPRLDAPAGNDNGVVMLTVHGMSCPLCATNVDKQLLRVPGVEDVNVNLSTGVIRVQVSQEEPPSAEALAKAVRESGFTLVDQQPGQEEPPSE